MSRKAGNFTRKKKKKKKKKKKWSVRARQTRLKPDLVITGHLESHNLVAEQHANTYTYVNLLFYFHFCRIQTAKNRRCLIPYSKLIDFIYRG